jgi:rubrerythrin
MSMSTTETTGTRDVTYDLISVVYHALQGAETYQMYEQDAKQEGDQEAAALFHEAHQASRQWADRAKTLLGQRMSQSGGQGGSGQRS